MWKLFGCAVASFVVVSFAAVLGYLFVGLLTVLFFVSAIGEVDAAFAFFLLIGWPIFWAMGLIFAAAALGAPH